MSSFFFVNRFYAPDHSATSQLLTDLAEYQVKKGDRVTVITSRLKYGRSDRELSANEVINGVNVVRVWTSAFGRGSLAGRACDFLTFYFSAFVALLRHMRKGDLVVAKTDPPMISVVVAIASVIRRARMVNWLQDLFPEVADAADMRIAKGVPGRLLKTIRNWSLRKARFNVAIGHIMAQRIQNELADNGATIVIPNWVIHSDLTPVDRDKNRLRQEWQLQSQFVVGYSGNLGLAHDCQAILDAIRKLKSHESIRFLFIGGGAGYDHILLEAQKSQLDNVSFKPYQDLDLLSESLSVPDIHLVSLLPEMEGLIVPSKMYGVLAVGRPMMFIGDDSGEIGSLIKKFDIGCVVNSEKGSTLAESILYASQHRSALEAQGIRARALYESSMTPDHSKSSWRTALLEAST